METTLTELRAMAAAARAGVGHTLLLANEVTVIRVAADPKPQHAIRDADTQGAIIDSDADRPKTANLFEM